MQAKVNKLKWEAAEPFNLKATSWSPVTLHHDDARRAPVEHSNGTITNPTGGFVLDVPELLLHAPKGKGKKGEADPACGDEAEARTGNTVLLAVVLPAGATAAQIAALENDVAATMLAALKASAATASASASDFSVEYDPVAKAFRVIFSDAALAGGVSIEDAATAAETADFSTLATDSGDAVAVGTIETTTTTTGSGSGSAPGAAAMMAGVASPAQPKSDVAHMATLGVAATIFVAVGAAIRLRKRRRTQGYQIVVASEAPAKETTPLLA